MSNGRMLRGAVTALLLALAPSIGATASPRFDFPALQELIAREQIHSIEALLAALPAELRSHYVLVFTSRSLQQGSFRDPRAILYGADGHLMLSFNGDPSERGFATIESVEFDPILATFRFREIRFVSSAGAPVADISEVDPLRCQRCHGSPTRPLWDSSPLWPGAYGERYRANLGSAERMGLRQFLQQQPTHPRYRALLNAQRLAYRDTYAPAAGVQYSGEQREPPNAEFSALLLRMNLQMIARQLRAQPGFAALRYALLGAADGRCGAAPEFLPESLRTATASALRRYEDVSESERERQREAVQHRALPGTATLRVPGAGSFPSASMDAVRFLAATGLRMTTQDWSLALEKGPIEVPDLPGLNGALADELSAAISAEDPRLAQLASARDFASDDSFCAYLRISSRRALADFSASAFALAPGEPPVSATAAASAPGTPLQHCATCHGDGTAPPLPFGDAGLLAPQLRQGSFAHGDLLTEILFRISPQAGAARMPPDAMLSPLERAALGTYLGRLAQQD